MPSTILSSLAEPIHHNNALAIVTDNWIVVRDGRTKSQSVISIASLSKLVPLKTTHVVYLAFSAGSLLVSLATYCSRQSEGTTLPFAGVGIALLITAQFTRRASIAFVVDSEIIQTRFGSLREAAMLVAAVRSVQQGRHLAPASPFHRYAWVRDYITLLV